MKPLIVLASIAAGLAVRGYLPMEWHFGAGAIWGLALLFLLRLVDRQHMKRLANRRGVMFSKYTGGAYADMGEVVESEIEKIQRAR